MMFFLVPLLPAVQGRRLKVLTEGHVYAILWSITALEFKLYQLSVCVVAVILLISVS